MDVKIEAVSEYPEKVIGAINYEINKNIAFAVDMAFVERGRELIKNGKRYLVADFEALRDTTIERLGLDPYVSLLLPGPVSVYANLLNARFFEIDRAMDVYALIDKK